MAQALPQPFRRLLSGLPQPNYQLHGRRPDPPPLPSQIVCFQRQRAADLNKPRTGRALHHRFVLMCALRTAATVCVDDRNLRLHAGEGLLVFPFQFHHYLRARREDLAWLFITFELDDPAPLAALRYRPFKLTRQLRRRITDLVDAYKTEKTEELPVLLLALLLAHLRHLKPAKIRETPAAPETEPGLVFRVDRLAQKAGAPPSIKALSHALNISPSHLRARFRASCGVSLGHHLRQLRLERARGLLRFGPQRVSEIAELCGFSSLQSFSRAFTQAFGQSPLNFRQRGDARKV